MRKIIYIVLVILVVSAPVAQADNGDALDYGFQLAFERSALEGLSLGADPAEDRLVEEDYEIELDLEYEVNDTFYLFLTAALVDETETVENSGVEESVSGLERKRIGAGYLFGETVHSELTVGRLEFVSASEWWLWWDEELDAVRLESYYGDYDVMLGFAEEQARENTDDDFIDPEFDGVKRSMLNLGWEVAPRQSIILYYLDQRDDSKSFQPGDFEDSDRIDEEDADLRWTGISYLGNFEIENFGTIDAEIHSAHVSGDETVYEFGDPEGGLSEVEERNEGSVSGSARGVWLGWRPAALDRWRFIVASARGSGDGNPDNDRDKSFRQTGLQGDSESLGELYQPELSNLNVDIVGFDWQVTREVKLTLLRYDYEQARLAEEMRDVSIENDLTGESRDLGHEIDLVLTIDVRNQLDIVLTAAEFDPGKAYGDFEGETANFINFELAWEF